MRRHAMFPIKAARAPDIRVAGKGLEKPSWANTRGQDPSALAFADVLLPLQLFDFVIISVPRNYPPTWTADDRDIAHRHRQVETPS